MGLLKLRQYLSLKKFTIYSSLAIFIGALSVFLLKVARAETVPPLPDDNLISNPWFRSVDDWSAPSFEGWIEDGQWVLSKKNTNPSPDQTQGVAAKLGPSRYGGIRREGNPWKGCFYIYSGFFRLQSYHA